MRRDVCCFPPPVLAETDGIFVDNQLPRDIQRQRSNPPPDSGSSTDPNFIQGAPVLPWPQSGMPVRYDTSQALQQPHVGPNFGSEYDPVHLVEPNVGYVYENHGFVRQQSSGPMDVAWPLGPAGVQNTLWGPYSQVYIALFLRQSLTEDDRAGRTMVRKRKALIVCNRQTCVLHGDSYGRPRLESITSRIQTVTLS